MPALRAVRRTDYRSWGGTVAGEHLVLRPRTPEEAAAALAAGGPGTALACGSRLSYGDVGLNPGGRLIDCRGLDRFIDFDRDTGILTCEAGVRLADILAALCRPEPEGGGWFLPVSPGTRFVTVGGAIANDVHGKNHHREGCFGRHVVEIELARGDGSVLRCGPGSHPDLFRATIGGLGLTGVILRARLRLRRVAGTGVAAEDIRMSGLADFFALAAESDAGSDAGSDGGSDGGWEYTAAWIDCLATGAALGRGIFSRARHQEGAAAAPPPPEPALAVPIALPLSPLNGLTLRAFNAAYFRRLGGSGRRRRIGSYEPVLYPLDRLGHWNRLYGRRGFFQFQCVVPPAAAPAAIAELLGRIAAAREGSMLAVLKTFGDLPSPGLLSFPMPGATLALDFPDRGTPTRRLLAELERVVIAAEGRLYPAKDALMSIEAFRRGYPGRAAFLPWIDPAMSSGFGRRVGLDCRTRAAA